jgi:hypothetical protein
MRLGSKLAEGRSGDQMRLGVENVADGGVGGEEPLGRGSRLQLLLLSLLAPEIVGELASSCRFTLKVETF